MNNNITKIKNVSSSNYESRDSYTIRNIVIGMTNNTNSGYRYAKSYKQPLSPKITFNYIIDKEGSIYQTIDDSYAPFTINASNSPTRIDNKECISICFIPEWNGSSLIDEYDSGVSFPSDPEIGQQFLLTKIIKYKGSTIPSGLYYYNGIDWEIEEAITSEDIKRPYESEEWSISEDTEKALLSLTKWLQNRYSVNNARVLRIYDYYRTYNPAPYIYDDGHEWNYFKNQLNETSFEYFTYIEESVTSTSESINATNKEREIADLIEQYGPDAKVDNTFTAEQSSLSRVNDAPIGKFSFQIGIRDTMKVTPDTTGLTNKGLYSGTLWDVSNTIRNAIWRSYLFDNSDEFDFEFKNSDFKVNLKEGQNVGYWLNNIGGFNGNIFKITQNGNNKEMLSATAYGWLRYLKCDGWLSFENLTASQIFAKACSVAGVPFRIVDNSSYVCKTKTCYGKTLYETILEALNETMVYEKRWYVVQPVFDNNGGGLVFRDILNKENIQQIKFSEGSGLLDWKFDSSIDDSANIVITYTQGDNGGPGTLVGSAKDESTIQEWGRLSKVIEDPGKEIGALSISAESWLTYYNSPRRHITLNCIGIPGIVAGNIIYLEIENIVSVGDIKGCLIVDTCTHTIESDKHTMQLECEIVQDGTLRETIYTAVQNEATANANALLEVPNGQ